MKVQILILFLAISEITFGQIGNEKDLIVKNNVKSSLERHCFLNTNGSCTTIYEKFDKNGNSIEWNMGRLGIIYRNVFDENDNKIMMLWVGKSDTTQIDTIQYKYDKHNELIQQGITEFENTYDKTGHLIKIVTQSKNIERNIVKTTITRTWTIFGKIDTETNSTEILEVAKKTKCDKFSKARVDYQYDRNQNLTMATYFQADTISKTISYKYDSTNRLIEKIEDDPERADRVNKMGFGNRDEIKLFKTTIQYNPKGQIDELYTYFSDPCMGLDNHFLYKHYYKSNGLLDYADVYENGKLVFTIKYAYEYYK
ncbi:hypothetical protein AAG747_05050 [Rapidithrix thailandica]|uniref:YD repeat-containing protein n=1 Tax=Rapidithrix thailandica TaxID=413964 RepID=A0AAW9S7G0_9BACT